jgi:hypothetical protein
MSKLKLIVVLLVSTITLSARTAVTTPGGSNLPPLFQRNFNPDRISTLLKADDGETARSKMSANSFFVTAGVFLPSKDYLNPDYNEGDISPNAGADFEFGQMFRLYKSSSDLGIGIRATYLNAGYTSYTDFFFTISVLTAGVKVGPQLTIPFTDNVGGFLYYQIGGQYVVEMFESESIGFFGLTHDVALGAKFKDFDLGAGYHMGGLANIHNTVLGETMTGSFPSTAIRIFVGYKF